MTLPVASYEELLSRVRSLTHETRQLQRELDSPPRHSENLNNNWGSSSWCHTNRSAMPGSEPPELPDPNSDTVELRRDLGPARFQLARRQFNRAVTLAMFLSDITVPNINHLLNSGINNNRKVVAGNNSVLASLLRWPDKEQVTGPEAKEQDERKTSPESSASVSPGGELGVDGGVGGGGGKWPADFNLWHSVGPSTAANKHQLSTQDELSVGMGPRSYSQHQLGAKVEMVYSLLSMLRSQDRDEMTQTLLALSTSPDSCLAMRQSGCLPLLVQLVHGGQESEAVRRKAAQALHNVVHCHSDDKRGRREARVLRLAEQLQEFCTNVTQRRCNDVDNRQAADEVAEAELDAGESGEQEHPNVAIAALMKLSFDEEHRHAMCQLGALQAIATLVQVDVSAHGGSPACVTLRRHAGMALTNLTFGDCDNKALLCSMRGFLPALVSQLLSPNEDLRQVTASVLRNLSWRADAPSKQALRQAGTCAALMATAMQVKKESTIKSVLSALWNLSAHCNMNKADICAVEGALQYLVEMLRFQDAPSKTLAIVENAGGILRNISSHIAVRDDYRAVLRDHSCLPLLLQQLKSPSLTVVSNACGTLWNLSACSGADQRALWELGAVPMLRALVHSKHKMISMGSSAALRNLLAARPDADVNERADRGMPSLLVRKRLALQQELDISLAETCDNIEPHGTANTNANVATTINRQQQDNRLEARRQAAQQHQLQRCEVVEKSQHSATVLMERLTLDEPVNYSLKYSEQEQEQEEERKERPVNYGLKYGEETKPTAEEETDYAETDLDQPTDFSLKYNESDEDNKERTDNAYVETDLDQPTDYSLRYAEEDMDKPKTYCTEGTPYTFSTATSLSDLRTPPDLPNPIPNANASNKSVEAKSGGLSPVGSLTHSEDPPTHEGATMTLGQEEGGLRPAPQPSAKVAAAAGGGVARQVQFETPLMFSRCSSLGSLSSCEPPDPDDRSSVVSEFSRMTSGMVSPSELPDSPTQTVPPSPRCPKPPTVVSAAVPGAVTSSGPMASVFEERVSVFKEENTPVQFSTATSLSDLTFDDDQVDGTAVSKCDRGGGGDEGGGGGGGDAAELAPVSEEEDDDMLAACINIGISQHSNRVGRAAPVVRSVAPTPRPSGIPRAAPVARHPPPSSSHSEALDDSTTVFRTEDTPVANVSHATSHSDLSALLSHSDDSDHDHILAECIQSGMPQARLPPNNSVKRSTGTVAGSAKVATVLPMPGKPSLLPARRAASSLPFPVKSESTTDDSYSETIMNSSSKSEKLRQISPEPGHASPLSSLDPDDDETLAEQQERELLEQCISSGMPTPTQQGGPKNGLGGPVAAAVMRDSDTWATDSTTDCTGNSLSLGIAKPRLQPLDNGKVGIISNLEMESSLLELECVRPPSCMGSLLSLTASMTQPNPLRLPPTSWHNLEHTKPPSVMDEVFELENSMLSCASLTSEIASPPPRSPSPDPTTATLAANDDDQSPRLTPRLKRQMLKDRYNTYTITGDKSSRDSSLDAESNLESDIAEQPEGSEGEGERLKPKKRTTPKQRRMADKERFRTRTLGEVPSQLPPPLSPRDKRNSDKDRFRTQTINGPTARAIIAERRHQESEEDEKCGENEENEKPRPVVVKPTEPKSVRGRKKARSQIPVVNRGTGSAGSKSNSPKPATIATPSPLQRQGTFTKAEPAASGIPLKKAGSGSAAKSVKSTVTPQQRRVASAGVGVGNGRGRTGSLPRTESASAQRPAGGVRPSKSNQSLKSAAIGSSRIPLCNRLLSQTNTYVN